MSRAIIKVVLDAGEPMPQVHQLPFGSRPIAVGLADECDSNKIAVWFEGNPEAEKVGMPMWPLAEGAAIPGLLQHIGSTVTSPRVWHVYMGRK